MHLGVEAIDVPQLVEGGHGGACGPPLLQIELHREVRAAQLDERSRVGAA